MHWYTIQETLTHTAHPPQPETPAVVLLTSEELDHHPTLPGLETVLLHTPSRPGRQGVQGGRAVGLPVRHPGAAPAGKG